MSSGYPYHTDSARTSHGVVTDTGMGKPKGKCSVFPCWQEATSNVTYTGPWGKRKTGRCDAHITFGGREIIEVTPIPSKD